MFDDAYHVGILQYNVWVEPDVKAASLFGVYTARLVACQANVRVTFHFQNVASSEVIVVSCSKGDSEDRIYL